ncbi:hypothetical protein BDW74DRAFT_175163 [Aspergillus multicolor]|uniref:uncharacterized protein n=1 Tax=Aspergillus multicolor TaxID=41759 RepID=UPI003CCC8F27
MQSLGLGTGWLRAAPKAGKAKSAAPLVQRQEPVKVWQDAIERFGNCKSFKVFQSPCHSYGGCYSGSEYDRPGPARRKNRKEKPKADLRLRNGESFSYELCHTDAYMLLINIIQAAWIDVEKFVFLPPYIDMDRVDTAHLVSPAFLTAWASIRKLDIKPDEGDLSQQREGYVAALIGLAPKLKTLTQPSGISQLAYL